MNWKTSLEKDHGVEVKVCKDSEPNLVAVFDDDKRVTEPVAAMQAEEVSWEAVGYTKAKAKYSDEIKHDS